LPPFSRWQKGARPEQGQPASLRPDCPNGLQMRALPSLRISFNPKLARFIGLLSDANPFPCRPETGGRKELVCKSVCKLSTFGGFPVRRRILWGSAQTVCCERAGTSTQRRERGRVTLIEDGVLLKIDGAQNAAVRQGAAGVRLRAASPLAPKSINGDRSVLVLRTPPIFVRLTVRAIAARLTMVGTLANQSSHRPPSAGNIRGTSQPRCGP